MNETDLSAFETGRVVGMCDAGIDSDRALCARHSMEGRIGTAGLTRGTAGLECHVPGACSTVSALAEASSELVISDIK